MILCFVLLSIGSALGESLTYDEVFYQEEASLILTYGRPLDPYNPPLVRILTGMPVALGLRTFMASPLPLIRALPARLVSTVLGVVLVSFIYILTFTYFGSLVAVVSVFLTVFDPNILSYAHYTTSDLGATVFFFLSFMAFLRWMRRRTTTSSVVLGLATGFAFSTKITVVPYFIVTAALLLAVRKRQRLLPWIGRQRRSIGISLFVCLVAIWSTYFFQTDVIISNEYHSGRVSYAVVSYAERTHNNPLLFFLDVLTHQPVPLGRYMATVKNNLIRSTQKANIYLFGGHSSGARWDFLARVLLFKTPLPLLILLAASILLRGKSENPEKKHFFVFALPVVGILLVSMVSRLGPMIRYVLPIYPFIHILAATSVSQLDRAWKRMIFGILLLWYAVGTLNQYPHFISYANELAGERAGRYRLFSDSNIDWGQSVPDVVRFVKEQRLVSIQFSYFGRDDVSEYGLTSSQPFGSYKFDDICAFKTIGDSLREPEAILISVSNWYYCGYYQLPRFYEKNIQTIIGDSVLVF